MLCHLKSWWNWLVTSVWALVNSLVPYPYMWQLVFAYISIMEWVIHSDEDGFFDGSFQIVIFSAHNAEVDDRYIMTSDVVMLIDGWLGFHVFFVSFSKCSAKLPNVLILTVQLFHTYICISPHFSARWYLYPWFDKKVLDSTASREVYLYAMFAADVFTAFTHILGCMAPLCEVCWNCWEYCSWVLLELLWTGYWPSSIPTRVLASS